MSEKKCAIIVVLASQMMLWSLTARANPFDIYGGGARSSAMGGAQTAQPEGAQSIYDNVAGLAGQNTEIRMGTFATFGDAPILLRERPEGYNVPDLTGSDALPSSETRQERSDIPGPRPLFGGAPGSGERFWRHQDQGGVLVMLPTNGLLDINTHFADERERYFSNQLHHEVLGSRIHRPVIELGLARKLTDWLSFGVGGTYLPTVGVGADAYVGDTSDQSDVELNADVDIGNSWGLLTGLIAELPGGFDVGVAYRGGVSFAIEGANELQVRGVQAREGEGEVQQIRWVPNSTPSMLKAGVAWSGGDVQVTLDGRYSLWSSYLDTQGEEAGFENILEGRVGAQWQASEDTRLWMGAGFIPSPVPAQTGRTNYVDNSRILGSVGGGHQFELAGRALEASWFVQLQHLLFRETEKEELDSYPDCSAGERALCDEVPDELSDPRTGSLIRRPRGYRRVIPGFPALSPADGLERWDWRCAIERGRGEGEGKKEKGKGKHRATERAQSRRGRSREGGFYGGGPVCRG